MDRLQAITLCPLCEGRGKRLTRFRELERCGPCAGSGLEGYVGRLASRLRCERVCVALDAARGVESREPGCAAPWYWVSVDMGRGRGLAHEIQLYSRPFGSIGRDIPYSLYLSLWAEEGSFSGEEVK